MRPSLQVPSDDIVGEQSPPDTVQSNKHGSSGLTSFSEQSVRLPVADPMILAIPLHDPDNYTVTGGRKGGQERDIKSCVWLSCPLPPPPTSVH